MQMLPLAVETIDFGRILGAADALPKLLPVTTLPVRRTPESIVLVASRTKDGNVV